MSTETVKKTIATEGEAYIFYKYARDKGFSVRKQKSLWTTIVQAVLVFSRRRARNKIAREGGFQP